MKAITLIIITSILALTSVKAQSLSPVQLDSLYNKFVQYKNPSQESHPGIMSVPVHDKCSFGLISSIKYNYKNFSSSQKKVLDVLLSRPASDTSFVSPHGFFRIHFTKSDFPNYIPDNLRSNIPADQLQKYKELYLDSLGIALDSAYNFEVNYLGYPPPPSDGTAGGDGKYDIYIERISDYGGTYPETPIGGVDSTYTSYMEISNDYSGYYTDGINAARVTVAHEFHHAIQIGNYIYRYDLDGYFYELTSTSMEHFVYPAIHDYYNYLPYYFYHTQNSFTQNGTGEEYALAIWNIFLKDKFGYGIIKKQWELMTRMRAIRAISNSLTDYNTSFGAEFGEFGVWTYFTNYRTVRGKYFENASQYPIVRPRETILFNSSPLNTQGYTEPLTNTFLSIHRPSGNTTEAPDSLCIIITNSDISSGIDSNYSSIYFAYNLYSSNTDGSYLLTDNYFYSFSTNQPALWLIGAILNNEVLVVGQTGVVNSGYVYPSPFNYKNNYSLHIPVKYNTSGFAQLNIYDITMKLVYSASKKISNDNGKQVLFWNALSNNNEKLSSGVYIYVIKSGDNITKGKLVIFNE